VTWPVWSMGSRAPLIDTAAGLKAGIPRRYPRCRKTNLAPCAARPAPSIDTAAPRPAAASIRLTPEKVISMSKATELRQKRLDASASVPPANNGTVTDSRGTWLLSREVASRFGFNDRTLGRWRESCPELGRPLEAKRTYLRTDVQHRREFWVYLESDLNEIVQARSVCARGSSKGRWLTAREASEEFGYSTSSVTNWARRGHQALGKRVRSRIEYRRINPKGRFGNVPVYSTDDLEEILRFSRSEDEKWLPANQAVIEYGLSYTSFSRWRIQGNCPLIGKPIRAKQIAIEHLPGRIKKVWHYHRDDLDEYRAKIGASEKLTVSEGVWVTTTEATNLFGWTCWDLYRWRRNGCAVLSGQVPKSRWETRRVGRKRRKVLVWFREDLGRIHENERLDVDGEWITVRTAESQFGVRIYKAYTRKCPALGRPMRAMKIRRGRTREVWVFHREDVREVAVKTRSNPTRRPYFPVAETVHSTDCALPETELHQWPPEGSKARADASTGDGRNELPSHPAETSNGPQAEESNGNRRADPNERKNTGGRPEKYPNLRKILSDYPEARPPEIKSLYWKYNSISEERARQTGFPVPTIRQITQARGDLNRKNRSSSDPAV
jgi:hypothetical protein